MTIRTVPSKPYLITEEIEVTDRYGDTQIIRKNRRGYQVQRSELSPVVALNKELSVLIGQRVKAIRESRGWKLEELARRAGLRDVYPKERMWSIENAVRRSGITLGTVYSLALALDVDVAALLPPVSAVSHIAQSKVRRSTSVERS